MNGVKVDEDVRRAWRTIERYGLKLIHIKIECYNNSTLAILLGPPDLDYLSIYKEFITKRIESGNRWSDKHPWPPTSEIISQMTLWHRKDGVESFGQFLNENYPDIVCLHQTVKSYHLDDCSC